MIRALFRPSQPSVENEARNLVLYTEIAPDSILENYVYCYWELKTNQPLGRSFSYRVVSDGCIDILLETSKADQSFITGFAPKFLAYDLGTSFHYIGVRFLPGGFPLLFDFSAVKLVNQFLPLEKFLPEMAERIAAKIKPAIRLSDVKLFFDRYLKDHLEGVKSTIDHDPRFFNAMAAILKANGNIDLHTLDSGISERQLRRLFEHYFGDSPKVFAKVVRFQSVIRAKPTSQSLKSNKIFYDAGYYDQAHFIKEFKNFYGVTPAKALRG